ncbi:MAG TPA: hypothetical protein DDZ43_15780, partial [Hyphomonadaceae bacterium]|nr:hypothetical protein [Hyphomonadaceae bacterium]
GGCGEDTECLIRRFQENVTLTIGVVRAAAFSDAACVFCDLDKYRFNCSSMREVAVDGPRRAEMADAVDAGSVEVLNLPARGYFEVFWAVLGAAQTFCESDRYFYVYIDEALYSWERAREYYIPQPGFLTIYFPQKYLLIEPPNGELHLVCFDHSTVGNSPGEESCRQLASSRTGFNRFLYGVWTGRELFR